MSPEILGRSQPDVKMLEQILKRNPKHRNKFVANQRGIHRVITSAPNKFERSIFLAMSHLSRKLGGNGWDTNTNVLIVMNNGNRKKCLYFF